MNRYSYHATYATETGARKSASFVLEAKTLVAAMEQGRRKIVEDKRRKFAGKLDVTVTTLQFGI